MQIAGKTVLVADDNPGIVDLITMLLDDLDLNVETASNGEDALAMARKTHPDLILLDIMMPAMDGWEVAARLLSDDDTADIPIIFLTARAKAEEQMRGWEMPIFEYITKPFSADDLINKIERILSTPREKQPELREQMKREKLRQLLGMEAGS